MNDLHLGRGYHRGALTVFPVWGPKTSRGRYSADVTAAQFEELAAGPSVPQLNAVNLGDLPLLLTEGELLEGGWQTRMVARSTVVPAGQSAQIEVVCVEQGRWEGLRSHRATGRRGSVGLRATGRTGTPEQSQVWARVAQYDAERGASATSSFADHADRAADAVDRLVAGIHPMRGQTGVLVGIAGQPAIMEVFDQPRTLRQQFDAILRAAGFDALDFEPEATPTRRAVRFLNRAGQVPLARREPAGAGTTVRGTSSYADLVALDWQDHVVHLKVTNPRHRLYSAVTA